jgi:outer membrane receptor protein involved in Fe transport
MSSIRRDITAAWIVVLLAATAAVAQVQTGSITGIVTDSSNAVLPGATITLTGDRLIGGAATQVADASGAYRFDRLPPGTYVVKFELQGFKSVTYDDVRISAAFVATVNGKLEVGSVSETITVTGESPTIDTKSNLQQTVMSQEILEGVPTGRDPWSLAKLIPGVQVATYDVGGTQSMQQSSMSAHGSNTNDVNYNIDGASVNWPGGGGGATMLYYDQGMFEEVNYMTSAIPAEVMAGGVSINMVTKDGGNHWKGNLRYSFANDSLQSVNHLDAAAEAAKVNQIFLGNPTQKTYDLNLSGGGALVQNRLWVNGTIRKWVVNKKVNAKNPDGSQALDDNDLKNYSGKAVTSITPNNKVSFSYLWNNKIRGHRRDTPPNIVPDIAALVQTNPASTTQAKYTGIKGHLVYESNFSVMDGQTNYLYQPGTPAAAIRRVDNTTSTADFAASREEHQPNSRHQFDNIFTYAANGVGGDHLLKAGVQWGRLYYESQQTVLGDHYVEYSNGVPTQIREWNTPTNPKNIAKVLGFFVQDGWTVGSRLTLNLGMRYDTYKGILPDQSNPGGTFIAARSLSESEVIDQKLVVWRTGASYDLMGNGRTALKGSYSRYPLQVGIDRVTNVNSLSAGSRTCPWSDPNGDGKFQTSEVNVAQCSAFTGGVSTFYASDGVDWPYSDEVTAGVETQVAGGTRLGAMFYYRTNKAQFGQRNTLVPTSSYTPFSFTVPNGPGGTVASPKPMTITAYNLAPTLASAQNNIRDNDAYLDTEYKGVEFTANKRFSRNWQMVAGLTIGKNEGGLLNPTNANPPDLNDPNVTAFKNGIIGNDSQVAFRLSGSYLLPADINLAGSLISNSGYPFVSTYQITRAGALAQGVALTRASQTVTLSERGDERFKAVTMVDLRLSRAFRFGARKITPQLDIFNIGNADTVVSNTVGVGSAYLAPAEILAPRIVRVGFSIDF